MRKKITCRMVQYLCMLSVILLSFRQANAQANYWALPPLKWNMQTPTVTNTTIPGAASTAYYLSNGAFDDLGNMLFYVRNNSVYGPTGTYVGDLLKYYANGTPGAAAYNWDNPGSELAIVPIPGQCKQFYIIYSMSNGMSSSTALLYMKIDCTGGTPVLTSPTADPTGTVPYHYINMTGYFAGAHSAIAVSKLTGSSVRYLFVLANVPPVVASIERFTISSTGIGSEITTANETDYPALFTYGDFYANELELSPDQKYLAWGHTDIGNKLNVVELNPATYAKVAGTTYNISAIQGLEFNNNAGVSTRIFVSTYPGGISYVNLGTSTVNTIPSSSTYNNTYLEMAKNGFIFGVNNTGTMGYFDGNAASYTSTSIIAAPAGTVYSNSGCPLYGNEVTYRLPDQIDGDIYPTANPTISGPNYACSGVADTYTLGGNYNSSTTYTWTVTGGTPSTYTGTSQTLAITWTTAGGTISVSSGPCTTPTTFTVNSCCQVNVAGKTTVYLNNVTENVPVTYSPTTSIYVINGTYTINSNAVTFNNCPTYFAPNAQVTVNSGGYLKIQGGSVWQAGCNSMWNGIILNSPGKLLVDASTVQDAKLAVDSKNGAQFTLSNASKLNANYRNILVETYAGVPHPGTINNTTISCLNGAGTAANCLIAPYVGKRTYSGIELNDVNQLNVGLDASGQTNTFNNMDKGIISARSGLQVYNNTFTTITYAGVGLGRCIITSNNASPSPEKLVVIGGTGNAYQKNTFINSTFGIYATTNQDLSVIGNTFTNMGEAADFLYCQGADNQLNFNENIINDCSWGLHAVGCEGSKSLNVLSNTINSTIVTPKPNSTGLSAENGATSTAGAPTLIVNSNTINSVLTGIKITNFTSPVTRYNNIYSLSDLGSSTQANGILATTCPFADLETNVIQGAGAADWWQNGIRVESCNNALLLHNSVENIGRGLFFGGTCTATETAKNHMLNNYDGFLLNYGVTSYQLGNPSACRATENKWEGSFTNHLYSWYSDGAQSLHYLYGSPVSTTVPGGSMNPIGLSSTYYPVLAGYSAIPVAGCGSTSGYVRMMDPKIAQLVEIARDEVNYPAYEESAKWMSKHALYTMIEAEPSLTANADLDNFMTEISVSTIAKLDKVNDLLAKGNADLAEVEKLLGKINAENIIEKNLKTVFAALVSIQKNGDPDKAQLSSLKEIAIQCPYEGGPGVYTARIILASAGETIAMNECEIVLPGRQENSASLLTASENNLSVMPNPNNGSFVISTGNDTTKDIFVYDVMGKVVFMKKATLEKSLSIDISSLPKGMFVVKVVCGNSLLTKRVITQ